MVLLAFWFIEMLHIQSLQQLDLYHPTLCFQHSAVGIPLVYAHILLARYVRFIYFQITSPFLKNYAMSYALSSSSRETMLLQICVHSSHSAHLEVFIRCNKGLQCWITNILTVDIWEMIPNYLSMWQCQKCVRTHVPPEAHGNWWMENGQSFGPHFPFSSLIQDCRFFQTSTGNLCAFPVKCWFTFWTYFCIILFDYSFFK